MLSVRLIAVGKLKEKFYIDAFKEYAKRLTPYCKFSCVEIAESSLDKEAQGVLKYEDKSAYKIALCIEGKKYSSTELSNIIDSVAQKGISKIDFIIGGSEGLDKSVKDQSDLMLSMSDMTFPHHLARIMITEQIYRSFKIIEGSAYHK